MSPFEALYGRKCTTPLLWSGVGECSRFGPDIIKEAEEKVKLIKDRFEDTSIQIEKLCRFQMERSDGYELVNPKRKVMM